MLCVLVSLSLSKCQDTSSAGAVCHTEWLPPGGNISYACCNGWQWNGQACVWAGRQCTLCFPCVAGDVCSCVGGGLSILCQAATLMCGKDNAITLDTGLFPTFNIPLDNTDWLTTGRRTLENHLNGIPFIQVQGGDSDGTQDRVAVFDSKAALTGGRARLLTVLYMQPPEDCRIQFELLMVDVDGSGNTVTDKPGFLPGRIDVTLVSGSNRHHVFSRSSGGPGINSTGNWSTVQLSINVTTVFQLEFEAHRGSDMIVAIDNIQLSDECCSVADDLTFSPPPDQQVTVSATPLAILPDLEVDHDMLLESLQLDTRNLTAEQILCSISENCLRRPANSSVVGPEVRALLRFSTAVWNRGPGEFRAPERAIPLFHQCHNHYHSFSQFSEYQLLDENGMERGHGHKASFCLFDSICENGTTPKNVICTEFLQGISPGCADIYEAGLDCQWVDMTGLSSGCYQLVVIVNPDRTVPETSYENNDAKVAFYFTGTSVSIDASCDDVFTPSPMPAIMDNNCGQIPLALNVHSGSSPVVLMDLLVFLPLAIFILSSL